jgi:hypothetical protein
MIRGYESVLWGALVGGVLDSTGAAWANPQVLTPRHRVRSVRPRAYRHAMGASERASRPAWQVLIALAGAATGIVIVVYLIGGVVVWERLHALRLSANQAVAPLPRNLLLINGVRALAWPVVLALTAAGLVTLIARLFRSAVPGVFAASAVLLVACVAGVVVLAVLWTWQSAVFLGTLGFVVVLAITAADRKGFAIGRVALGAAMAVAAVIVVVEVIDIATLPVRLEYATVRFTDEAATRGMEGREGMGGIYIGATSDAVYLAPLAPTCNKYLAGRIVALPQRDIAELDVYRSMDVRPWLRKKPKAPPPCPKLSR